MTHTFNENELKAVFNSGATVVLFGSFGTAVINKEYTSIDTLVSYLADTVNGRVI